MPRAAEDLAVSIDAEGKVTDGGRGIGRDFEADFACAEGPPLVGTPVAHSVEGARHIEYANSCSSHEGHNELTMPGRNFRYLADYDT